MSVLSSNPRFIARSVFWFILFLVLSGGATAVLIAELPDLLKAIRSVSPAVVIAAVILVAGNYAFRIQRWRLYLQAVGWPISFREASTAFLAGLIGCLTPGKAGEVVRCWAAEKCRVPYWQTIATIFVERLLDLLVILVFAVVGLFMLGRDRYGAFVLVLLLSGLGVLFLLSRVPVLRLFVRRIMLWWLSRLRMSPEVLGLIQGLLSGRTMFGGALLGVFGWFFEVLCLLVIAHDSGCDLSLGGGLAAFGVGILAGAASLIPGGLGVTEGTMTAVLIWQGCGLQESVMISLVFRLCTLWFGVVLGFVFSLWRLLRPLR